MKKWLLFLAGLLLAAVVLWRANPRELLTHILDFNPAVLAGLFALQLMTIGMITWQWQLLIQKSGYDLSYFQTFHVIMGGTFTECITPAVKAGGEAAKVVMLRDFGLPTARALAVAAGQKIISSLAFLALALTSLIWFTLTIPLEPLHRTMLLSTFAIVTFLTAAAVLLSVFPALVLGIPGLADKPFLQKGVASFRDTLSTLAEDKTCIAGHFILALTIWSLFAVKAYLAAQALGIMPGFGIMAAVTFLSYLAGMAPTPGGLGAFEGAVVILLAPIAAASAAMALAVVLRLVTFWFPFALSALWLGLHQTRILVRNLKSPLLQGNIKGTR